MEKLRATSRPGLENQRTGSLGAIRNVAQRIFAVNEGGQPFAAGEYLPTADGARPERERSADQVKAEIAEADADLKAELRAHMRPEERPAASKAEA